MPCFADAMARANHQVVLLTQALSEDEEAKSGDQVASELAKHDWSTPYLLCCKPAKSFFLRKQREGKFAGLLSKSVVAGNYLRKSGVFADWVDGARSYWPLLVPKFKPQICWATFGCTDAWLIAQSVADLGNIPWVMDIKDGWDPGIPARLRGLLARRFGNAAWMTSNSNLMADNAKKWFRQEHTTVYSGIASELIDCQTTTHARGEFHMVLIGSLYHESLLQKFLGGVETWLERLSDSERSHVRLTYAGSNTRMVEQNISRFGSACRVDCRGYLAFSEFVELIRSASVNAYLWRPATFHHKLVELLACGRPMIAFPGEHEESKALARQVSGQLNCCPTPEALIDCLQSIWQGRMSQGTGIDKKALQSFTWDSQVQILLSAFRNVLPA